MVVGLETEKDLEDERSRRASILSLLSLIICCVMYSDSESLAVLYVVLCIQTQKAWLYYMLCCVFGLRNPGCIIFCVMHSDSESLTVLHVVLCIQTQKICLYIMLCYVFGLRKPDQRHSLTAWLCYVSDSDSLTRDTAWLPGCAMSQTQWYVNSGKCGVCGDPWSQPPPRDNEAGGLYGKGIITRTYTPGQVIRSSHTPTHLDR